MACGETNLPGNGGLDTTFVHEKTGTTFYEIMCANTECEIGMREDITPKSGQQFETADRG